MGFFKAIKEIVSPVPSFGDTGPIKFRSMSFGTVIPKMTTGLPKRVTGYLSGYGL